MRCASFLLCLLLSCWYFLMWWYWGHRNVIMPLWLIHSSLLLNHDVGNGLARARSVLLHRVCSVPWRSVSAKWLECKYTWDGGSQNVSLDVTGLEVITLVCLLTTGISGKKLKHIQTDMKRVWTVYELSVCYSWFLISIASSNYEIKKGFKKWSKCCCIISDTRRGTRND